MRESRRTNFIILAALLMIAAAFAIYATMVMRWFAAPKNSAPAAAASSKAALDASLEDARREFRDGLLDPRAHLRLSEALWKAGRPVDSFYVMYAARQIFTDEDFRRAHAEVVLRAGGPAAAARSRLKGLTDPALAVPVHAEVARDYPDSPEGRDSLDQLSQLAMAADGSAGGDAGRIARTALDELYRADPKNPDKLAALAGADFGRGDTAQALALATEAWNKYPGQAGAARIMGMLALRDRDVDGALKWLSAAWDRDSDDLYSAAKLAQIYEKRRGDPEGALPFYLALYRQNPDYAEDEPAETRIRETLDHRRESLLKDAPVEGLGGRFKPRRCLPARRGLPARRRLQGPALDRRAGRAPQRRHGARAPQRRLRLIPDRREGARRGARAARGVAGQRQVPRAHPRAEPLRRPGRQERLPRRVRGPARPQRGRARLREGDGPRSLFQGPSRGREAARALSRRGAGPRRARFPEALRGFRFRPVSLFTDTHVHLGDAQFDADRADVLARAFESGVGRLVEIADNPDEWDRAISIAKSHPDRVRCSLGLHPYYADRFDNNFIPRLKAALASSPEAVAIGEIGLDYAKTQIPHDIQRRAFSALLAAGRDWNIPLVVHCRDAYMDLVPMLKDAFPRRPDVGFWGVVHCFSGTPDEARACAALGFALGADGPVTYKKNDSLREAFRVAGPDVAVLETDCPYLPPQSSRGKRNEPRAVAEIAAKLAEVWSLTVEEVARRTTANAAALYRWP